jgi:hypothetical protein
MYILKDKVQITPFKPNPLKYFGSMYPATMLIGSVYPFIRLPFSPFINGVVS